MNEFRRDDDWQRKMRNEILAPDFYGDYAVEGRYVFIDKGRLASIFQKRLAVDTIVQGRDGHAICIEEKIVRWSKKDRMLTAFALEVMSNTSPGFEKTGWMEYGQADYLLYCFSNKDESALDCYLMDFPALKTWFWSQNLERWPKWVSSQINKTMCRIVPISEVKANVSCWQKLAVSERLVSTSRTSGI